MTPNFIEIYEDAASGDLCDRVILALEGLINNSSDEHCAHYMEGSETNGGYANRQDYSFAFERIHPDLTQEVHSVLSGLLQRYGEKYPSFMMKPCYSNNMKVQKTKPKGGFHTWHCEHSASGNSAFRVLAWTLYLNDVADGEGETEFLEYGLKMKPKKGTVCLFPAAWSHVHRGNPVYTQDKYIATGWYYLTGN